MVAGLMNLRTAANNLSLRTKFTLVFLTITLLTIGLMTVFTTASIRNRLVSDAGQNLKSQAVAEALTLSNVLEREIDKLQAFSLNQLILNRVNEQNNLIIGTPDQIEEQISKLDETYRTAADDTAFIKRLLEGTAAAELQEYTRKFANTAEVFVTDRFGGLVASSRRTSDYAQADEDWWQKTWNDGQGAVYISNPVFDESSQLLAIIISVPIYAQGGGQPVGILRNTYQLNSLAELTQQIRVGQTGRGYLLFSDNTNLAPAGEALAAESAQVLSQVRSDNGRDFEEVTFEGVPSLASETPVLSFNNQQPAIDTLGWRLVIVQSSDETLQAITTVAQTILGISLAVLLLTVIVAVAFAYVLTTPIKHLTGIAIRTAAGDLTQRVEVDQQDEIGLLAQAFNTMVTVIQVRDQELKESAELLEQRVEQRTSELVASQHRVEQVSRAKSVFISNMSHELRTPLNVIIGYTSSMLDMPRMYNFEALPEVFRRDIELIRDNGRYLLGLINDILDMSKIEAGKLEMNWSRVNLNDMFKGILAIAVGLVRDKPIQVRLEAPDDLPVIWGDPIRIRQVILNLMANAIKFTKSGSVTLRAQPTHERVTVSIIDTGIGIPENALDMIFDRFQQAEHNIEVQYGGTGLGLDICKQLVEMHGGTLNVQSVVGQGSIFSFELLLAREAAAPTGAARPGNIDYQVFDTTQEADSEMAIHSVLLVEDDTATRILLHRVMESANYIVVDAADGSSASEMAFNALPDVILLDIHLPGMDGWQVIKDLKTKRETASIPVIVITGADNKAQAEDFGAEMYLQKPVIPEDLLRALEQVLSTNKVEDN